MTIITFLRSMPVEIKQIIQSYTRPALTNETITDAVNKYFGENSRNYDSFFIADLKYILRQRHISTKGTKNILIERLNAEDAITKANNRLQVIQTYGRIQHWNMSNITNMNPQIRIAALACIEYKKTSYKLNHKSPKYVKKFKERPEENEQELKLSQLLHQSRFQL